MLLGLVAGLAAVELGLRLLEPHDLRALHELRPDRPWLYGMQPNAAVRVGGITYATNADGFRDRTYPRAKPPGTFRVVVLGDSITLGWGVALEESFPKRLEQRLGPSVQVLSLGVAGYNPYTEAQLFADVGVGYRPDLVLVEFCINDLNDPTLHFDASTMASLGALPEAAFPDPGGRRPAPGPAARLCRRLRTCALLADRLAPGPDAAALAAALATHDQPSAAELDWLAARYGEIARAAVAAGARFAVVVFPWKTQVDGRASDEVERRLAPLGAREGWATIDLLPAFRAVRAGPPLFIDLWHPSAAGHRLAADALAVALVARGLVPSSTGAPATASSGEAEAGEGALSRSRAGRQGRGRIYDVR